MGRFLLVLLVGWASLVAPQGLGAQEECLYCQEEYEGQVWHRFGESGVFTSAGEGGVAHSYWATGTCLGVHEACEPSEFQEQLLLALLRGDRPEWTAASLQHHHQVRLAYEEGLVIGLVGTCEGTVVRSLKVPTLP
jgi:hypothetical protein